MINLVCGDTTEQARAWRQRLRMPHTEWGVLRIGGPLTGLRVKRAIVFYERSQHLKLSQFNEWLEVLRSKTDPRTGEIEVFTKKIIRP